MFISDKKNDFNSNDSINSNQLSDNLNIYMVSTILTLIILGTEFLMIRNYVNVLIFKNNIYFVCAILIGISLLLKNKNHN